MSSLWPPTVIGGAELYAAELSERLKDSGHDVGVVTLGVPGPDVVEAVPAWPYGVEDHAQQPPWRRLAFHARDQYDPLVAKRLARAIRRFRPDVVHSHAVPGMSAAALTAPGRAGVAHVHTLHDYWLLCQRSTLVARDDSACVTRCTGCRVASTLRVGLVDRHPPEVVVAVSDAVATEHRSARVLTDRIRVVRNPVEQLAAPTVARPRPADGPVVFGFLGQLVPIKGIKTLLRAFAALPRDVARLDVAGSGPLRDDVAGPGVRALGWVDAEARERFFSEIDVLVVPSEWRDPAPLVLNEAAARGIPVIGARIGGIPELVAPEDQDLLFPSGDASALTSRLLAFLDRPRGGRREPVVTGGWPAHLQEILVCYGDARRIRSDSSS